MLATEILGDGCLPLHSAEGTDTACTTDVDTRPKLFLSLSLSFLSSFVYAYAHVYVHMPLCAHTCLCVAQKPTGLTHLPHAYMCVCMNLCLCVAQRTTRLTHLPHACMRKCVNLYGYTHAYILHEGHQD